jgi:hypothetical protein
MKDQEWDFLVVDEPTVNAFVVPGGKVVVYTGEGEGQGGGRLGGHGTGGQ